MYTLLTLFFISLACIILMLARKVMLVRGGYIVVAESIPHPFVPDINKVKYLTLKGLKKLLYLATFLVLRAYVKLSNFINKRYQDTKQRIQNFSRKNSMDNLSSQKEVNTFLRVIADYKKKITKMKSRIDASEEKE